MCSASARQWWPVPDIAVVLPSVLQPLAGGQSVLTAPADGPVTVGQLLDSVTAGFAVLGRRLRDETGALRRFVNIYVDGDEVRRLQGLDTPVSPGQEVVVIQSVAGG
ncbi:molybdopterin synthase subunit MoaD [Pseudarthrobacter enclensis]|uniref:MoaD/ThiS family protein n=1 Tax=Pseudarthrobacter enclensis TaxID=993070 RepID=UPI0008159F47|nr:molybdopterin synthase subunit MoaD [Pseudarthrobacter enclensis]